MSVGAQRNCQGILRSLTRLTFSKSLLDTFALPANGFVARYRLLLITKKHEDFDAIHNPAQMVSRFQTRPCPDSQLGVQGVS
jgi:hypothetical protein